MFSSRAAARAFIPHTALPRQSWALAGTSLVQLHSRKQRFYHGTAGSWRAGSLFWQGNGGSTCTISLAGSQDQYCDPSAPAVLMHWQQRAGFVKKPCKNWFCSARVCSDIPAWGAFPIDQFVYGNTKMGKASAELTRKLRHTSIFTELANSASDPPITPESPPGMQGLLPHGHHYANLQPYTTPCRRSRMVRPHNYVMGHGLGFNLLILLQLPWEIQNLALGSTAQLT